MYSCLDFSAYFMPERREQVSILGFLGKKSEEKPAGTGRGLSQNMIDTIRDNLNRDFEQQPEKAPELDCFCSILEGEIREHVNRRQPPASEEAEGEELKPRAVDAASIFHVSEDHMEAYACILPPLNDGEAMTQEQFLENIRYGGITFGIDQEAVSKLISGQDYLRIVQVAQGEWPRDGEDGVLEELFERKQEQPLELTEEELRQGLDFRKQEPLQLIRKGEVICHAKRPVMPQDGKSVSGQALPGKAGLTAYIHQGENTKLSEDGTLLLADISGAVVVAGDEFTVRKLHIIEKDLEASAGDLHFDGNVLIQGSVKDGITINAAGNIIVEGSVQGGTLISGGTIRIQGEIRGTTETQLHADKQIQCTIMENAVAKAKEDICAEVIADSTAVSEGGCVYALMGRGLIFGGNVKANKSVYAKKIGNVSGCENCFMLGYEPELEEQIESLRTELEEIQGTCEKLKKTIADMQAAGMHRQRDKRDLYNKVAEQQTLYEGMKRKKAKQLKDTEIRTHFNKSSVLTCEEINPMTKVYIGGQELMIQNKETDCRVSMPVDQIMLR